MLRAIVVAMGGAACLTLASCGGSSGDAASKSDIRTGSPVAGVTPFIALVPLSGLALANLSQLRYTIAPKPGAAAAAVDVSYSAQALELSGYLSASAGTATLPVFGLYAGHNNAITVTLTFADGSRQTLAANVAAPAYADPQALFGRSTIRTAIARPGVLDYSYVFLKSGVSGPVVIDVDGEVRWVSAAPRNAYSSAFVENGFFVGTSDSTRFQRIELDGRVTASSVAAPAYTAFHHNIDRGKVGWLAEFNAFDAIGNPQIESLVTEIDASGRVLKEWNFAEILGNHMRSQGDDPAAFIRPGIDWFHVNSATYDARDDSIIASSRENFVVKVDYQTGRLLWVFGDPTKYWYTFPSLRAKALQLQDGGFYPVGQHAISLTSGGLLMLFNNGAPSFNQPAGAPVGESRAFSTVSTYRIDPVTQTAVEVWRFDNNQTILSDICSSAYETPTGSLLINYAAADNRTKLRVVGLDPSRAVVFDFEYPSSQPCLSSWNAEPISLNGIRFR